MVGLFIQIAIANNISYRKQGISYKRVTKMCDTLKKWTNFASEIITIKTNSNMKKLVLTMVALVAMATTSFAQFSASQLQMMENVVNDYCSSYSVPSVSYSLPSVSYSTPIVTSSVPELSQSTINALTTTVNSYTRNDGTFVQSHVRTMPNETNWDNFSTRGNTNPYTGTTGHRAKDYSSDALNYGKGHTIHQGTRGGQYYYNSNGNKT